jgi:hypothetical protein
VPADLLAAIDKHKDEPRKRVILRSAIKAAVLYDEASGVDSSDWSTLGVHAIEWVVASLQVAGIDEEWNQMKGSQAAFSRRAPVWH